MIMYVELGKMGKKSDGIYRSTTLPLALKV